MHWPCVPCQILFPMRYEFTRSVLQRLHLQDLDLDFAYRRTVDKPYPQSLTLWDYSKMWHYDVQCHPDSYRGPTPLYLHFALLNVLTALALLYLMYLRGESKTHFRMLVYTVSPVIALASLVLPMIVCFLRLVKVGFNAIRNRETNLLRVSIACREAVKTTVEDACGPLLPSLPEQKLPVIEQIATNRKGDEKVPKPTQSVDSLEGIPHKQPSKLPDFIVVPMLALLGYLANCTLLLSIRRYILRSNIVVDDYNSFLAIVALLVILHLISIMIFQPKSVRAVEVTLNTPEPKLVTEDDDNVSKEDDTTDQEASSSEQTQHPDRQRWSMLLLLRSSCAATTKTPLREIRLQFPYRIGQISMLEIWIAQWTFCMIQGFSADTEVSQSVYDLAGMADKFFSLGLMPFYVLLGHGILSVTWLYCTKFVTMILSSESFLPIRMKRGRKLWDAIPEKVGELVNKSRFPDSIVWMIRNWYFGLWAITFYSATCALMLVDASGLTAQKYDWGNENACPFLWVDPLSNTILRPIYQFNGFDKGPDDPFENMMKSSMENWYRNHLGRDFYEKMAEELRGTEADLTRFGPAGNIFGE